MSGIIFGNLTDDELLRIVDRWDPVIKELAERLEYANDQINGYKRSFDSFSKIVKQRDS
jgi:hypothetical protein